MTFFTIAAVQMPVSSSTENLTAMTQNLDAIMRRFPAVRMVIFSELCAYGPAKTHAQPAGGPLEQRFREMAMQHNVWLIPGSVYEQDGERIYNMTPVINPQGDIVARYRKMFPFLPYETGVEAGTDFCVFDVPKVGRFGISICYDKWFPETTRTMVMMGAEVILQPTMTDTIDRELELTIARTNAAINQCYFIDVNGVGDCGNGLSIVVGPAGDVIHQAGSGREIIPVELDLGRVRRERDRGLMSLGQPLKSYRDRSVDFAAAQTSEKIDDYLKSLGPLQKPV
ncbi:carbon-nitrogen hydrolase family protein [Undibacterium sp. Ji50W]|uniref:carbon-nitrogen hydrolase family protein n=1 Tax=Undibacterium sp. Ji50W TaxID=3413041 RepID=UPI003BF21306